MVHGDGHGGKALTRCRDKLNECRDFGFSSFRPKVKARASMEYLLGLSSPRAVITCNESNS